MYNNGSTRLYNVLMGNPVANNSIGRMGGTGGAVNDENYFQRRAKSIGNALGTTAAAVASKAKDDVENANTDRLRQSNKDRMNNIARKYGFDTWSDWQDAFYAAKDSGDSARVSEMENQLEEFKAQANSNAAETKKKADEYDDYRKNNFISEKINQDQGKFAGSAINTLSTAADVAMLLTGNPGGVALNATQGGLEGLADELEQNGFQNFDAGRASSNMLADVAGGAAAGKLNKAIGGRNLVPGAGKLSNLGNRALNTGLARGAMMGAVGGGVGAGTAAALNGQDVLGSAMEGVKQGAVQGAIAGGVMSGATKATNAALNRFSPETAQRVQNNAQAWENWKNSGSDFNERLTNTLTSGDSAVGEWIQGNRQSGLLNRAGGIGNRVQDVSGNQARMADNYNAERDYGKLLTKINDRAVELDNVRKAKDSFNSYPDESWQSDYWQFHKLTTDPKTRQIIEDLDLTTNPQNSQTAAAMTQVLREEGFIPDSVTPTTAKDWLKQAGKRAVEDINNSNLGNRVKNIDENTDRIPLDESIRRIENVRNNISDAETIGKLPLEYMEGDTSSPNIDYISRIANEKIMAGNAKNLSVAELAYSTNNYNRAKIIEFDKNGTGRLNIVRPVKDGKVAVIALEKQPDGNTLITTIRPNASSNYIRNLTKNKGANVLYDTTDGAATASITGAPAASQAMAGSTDSIISQREQNVNTPETEVYRTLTAKQENTPSVKDAENTLKTSKSSQLRYQAAQELLKQYGTVDKPTAKATNAPETIQKIAEAGFTKPGDVERIADNITGSNGEVNKLVQKLVASAKPVNTFDGLDGKTLTEFVDESIARNALSGINEGTAVKRQIEAYLNKLPSRRNGSISGTDDALEVMDVVRQLEAKAADYEGRGGNNYATTNPDKLNAAKVTKEVASLLKDRIFDTVDVKSALTPEVAADLKALAPKNEQWGKYVDEKIMTAKSVQDLRSIQAPWVRAKRIIDNGYLNSVTYGGRIGNSAPSLDRRNFVSNALDSVWNSNIAQRGKAIALNKAADIVDRTPLGQREGGSTPRATETTGNTPTPPPATQVYNAIGRMEAVDNGERARSAQYLANAAQEAEIVPNTGANTLESLASPTIGTGATSVYDSMYGGQNAQGVGIPTSETASAGTNSNSYFPTTGDYWVDLLGTAMTSAINAKDVDAFTSLYGMYQDALAQTSKNAGKDYSDPTNWSSSDRTKLLDAQNALGQIDTLESAYNQATGGNGGNVLQGNLRSLAANISGGNLDPSASNYNNLAQSIGMGIVKNMINLGVTESDAQRYLQYLPELTDTKEQATQKLATLRQIYQNQINNIYSAYGA